MKPLAFRRSLQEARSADEQGQSVNLADAVDREGESEGPVIDGGGVAALRPAERADTADFSWPARSRTPRLQARVGRSVCPRPQGVAMMFGAGVRVRGPPVRGCQDERAAILVWLVFESADAVCTFRAGNVALVGA